MEIMKLTLTNNQMSSNCYILINNKEAVVIDPGFEDNNLYNYLQQKDLIVTSIILTHGHYDHWGGLKKLQQLYPDALLYGSSVDSYWYEIGSQNPYNYTPIFNIDLKDKKTINIFDTKAKILTLPGHSAGSIGIYIDNKLFSGDVLFFESMGRTDLYQGNEYEIFKSIKKIYTLPKETIIYSGHGRPTSVEYEKLNNPFLRG